jgi:hypothetical protein
MAFCVDFGGSWGVLGADLRELRRILWCFEG